MTKLDEFLQKSFIISKTCLIKALKNRGVCLNYGTNQDKPISVSFKKKEYFSKEMLDTFQYISLKEWESTNV